MGDASNIRSLVVTRCGNFALLGTANGGIHKVNLQSCQWRGSSKKKASFFFCAVALFDLLSDVCAHVGAVEGVATDIYERVCISCGLDGSVRFWDLNDVSKMLAEIKWAVLLPVFVV